YGESTGHSAVLTIVVAQKISAIHNLLKICVKAKLKTLVFNLQTVYILFQVVTRLHKQQRINQIIVLISLVITQVEKYHASLLLCYKMILPFLTCKTWHKRVTLG